jgi:hypothetical protein
MSRRVAAAVLAALVVAAALVAIGRWERAHRADEQVAGMRRVLERVGPLASPRLSAFRYLKTFQCLLYERSGNPVALELCFAADGRLIEAIDRTGDDRPRIWSLRDDPSRSTIRVDRAEVDRLLVRMGVPARLIEAAHAQGGS